jgi:hypothetical protein
MDIFITCKNLEDRKKILDEYKKTDYDLIFENDESINIFSCATKREFTEKIKCIIDYHTIHLKHPNIHQVSVFYICMLAHCNSKKKFIIETKNKFSDYDNITVNHV